MSTSLCSWASRGFLVGDEGKQPKKDNGRWPGFRITNVAWVWNHKMWSFLCLVVIFGVGLGMSHTKLGHKWSKWSWLLARYIHQCWLPQTSATNCVKTKSLHHSCSSRFAGVCCWSQNHDWIILWVGCFSVQRLYAEFWDTRWNTIWGIDVFKYELREYTLKAFW